MSVKGKLAEANEKAVDATFKTADTLGVRPGLEHQVHGSDRGQLGFQTVLAALVVVIGVSLAVIIVDRFDSSLGTPDSSALSTAQGDVLSGFADMAGLIGPLLLVAIAIVIIGLLRQAR